MKFSSVLFFGVTLLSACTSLASAADEVIFYGGSSMVGWDAGDRPTRFEKNFGRTVFQHPKSIKGYSGAVLSTLTANSTQDVWNHKPRVVVFYGGENDLRETNITTGTTPAQINQLAQSVLSRFRTFVETRDATESKKSAILFISLKPSVDYFYKAGLPTATNTGPTAGPAATPAQVALSKKRKEAAWQTNTLIKSWIESDANPHKNLYYVNIWETMLVHDKPNPVYFDDFTHPSRHGYDRWAQVIRPEVNRIWNLTAPVN